MFDTPCRYQVIAGRDFLRRTGIDLEFKKNHITWMNMSIPMKSPHFSEANYNAVMDEYTFWMDEDTMKLEDFYFSKLMPFLDYHVKTTTMSRPKRSTYCL